MDWESVLPLLRFVLSSGRSSVSSKRFLRIYKLLIYRLIASFVTYFHRALKRWRNHHGSTLASQVSSEKEDSKWQFWHASQCYLLIVR